MLITIQPPPAGLPADIKARLWLRAEYFFSRSDAKSRCWLWLLREDGRLAAMNVDARHHGNDHLLPALLRNHDQQLQADDAGDDGLGQLQPLPHAPVVPLPRWAVSWGHPIQRQIRAFAEQLDTTVLASLGELEEAGGFWGSVSNYNRLIGLGVLQRQRRLQALREFWPLLAPLLLDDGQRPEMFTDYYHDNARFPQESQLAGAENVCRAIDENQNLVKALATHYRISRALVRSPICRHPWQQPTELRKMLRLIDAIPAHARPHSLAALEKWDSPLQQLLTMVPAGRWPLIAKVFSDGWSKTWAATQTAPETLSNQLRDSRDFLRAALEQEPLPDALFHLQVEELCLAWLLRRGLSSLLQASARWHAQPLQRILPEPDDGSELPFPALFTHFEHEGRQARELLSEAELVAEGEHMQHCVGGYWQECNNEAGRIVHLDLPDGESATAYYGLSGVDSDGVHFQLEELRGIGNARVSQAMQAWAEQVAKHIQADERSRARQQVLQATQTYRQSQYGKEVRHIRALDQRSRQELQQVIAWCLAHTHAEASPPNQVLHTAIAGTGYHQAATLLPQLRVGDALQLVREPKNPHDANAIRLDWQGYTLGYVPRRENQRLSRELDAGAAFQARLEYVDEEHPTYPHLEFSVCRLMPE